MGDGVLVLHAQWSDGSLHLWCEDASRAPSEETPKLSAGGKPLAHPWAVRPPMDALRACLGEGPAAGVAWAEGERVLRLPAARDGESHSVLPSAALERVQGGLVGGGAGARGASGASINADADRDVDFEDPTIAMPGSTPVGAGEVQGESPRADQSSIVLTRVAVPTVSCGPADAVVVIEALDDAIRAAEEAGERSGVDAGACARFVASASFEYLALCCRFSRHVLAQQRFVPVLAQTPAGDLQGVWQPWLADEAIAQRAALLVHAMPASARCAEDAFAHDAWSLTLDFVAGATDALCRGTLLREDFSQTIAGRDTHGDQHVAWLSGLVEPVHAIDASVAQRQDLGKRVRAWIGGLEDRGASSAWRLHLRLAEPDVLGMAPDASPSPEDPAWKVAFSLQSVETPALIVEASDIWLMSGTSAVVMGRRIEQPQDLLLKELGRASRIYKKIEQALTESEPSELALSTRHAYEFLREARPLLLEQGFSVEAPSWWDTPTARVGAKLRIESQDQNAMNLSLSQGSAGKPQLGLASLVNYTWEISVGDATLSLTEFESLAARRVPLVRVNGRWVEVRPEDVHAAIKFIRENPGGTIRLSEAMRLAYASDVKTTGIPVVGLEAQGWLAGFMNSEAAVKQLEMLPPPRDFQGTLRPYQARGVSWMMFQERLGFGVCLADDMGLGKTIQLLALLAYEREGTQLAGDGAAGGAAGSAVGSVGRVPPTLLLVPMSVVGNWEHETKRFCPHLSVLVHHGAGRGSGDSFLQRAAEADLVITTYSLAHRDRETLGKVKWGRIVLDEAQYIKNPQSKQSQAARAFEASNRVALTGTPVENRLSELWSIMDFLNPGYLGGVAGFRTRFAVPIERYHDKHKGEQLRGLIRPFVLRRLKSDPTVVSDLPAKVESREFSHLTAEQASMYEACVKRTLAEVDQAQGMQRRGIVLASLIKLKQICNHPGQALKDFEDSPHPPDPSRSGKCIRMLEMLDETLAEGDQSLVFTQFRQMGRMLEMMIRARFGREVLFIHGGVTQPQRQVMIEKFQKGDGKHPVLLLSLRAGGVGLNLTAATHVFHFDRWWNPAVENQATDRAYRIGQTRTVQVHKFVVRGTLEERIDQMIESKSALAENIIGQGEAWLSELSTEQLRDILTLRNDAIDDLD